jgi:hypothetical protein
MGGAGGTGGFTGCLMGIQSAGYSAPNAPPCSACNDNLTPLGDKCMAMIDCMIQSCPTPNFNCETNCFNAQAASGILRGCVDALTTAAGCM